MKILFICTGNTCRSPMAEGYFRYLLEKEGRKDIHVSSAGTFTGDGELPSTNSVAVLQEQGIDITGHRSRHLTPELLDESDLVVAMTASHRIHAAGLNPAAVDKILRLGEYLDSDDDITDPFGGDKDIYRHCFNMMKPALEKLLNELKNKNREESD